MRNQRQSYRDAPLSDEETSQPTRHIDSQLRHKPQPKTHTETKNSTTSTGAESTGIGSHNNQLLENIKSKEDKQKSFKYYTACAELFVTCMGLCFLAVRNYINNLSEDDFTDDGVNPNTLSWNSIVTEVITISSAAFWASKIYKLESYHSFIQENLKNYQIFRSMRKNLNNNQIFNADEIKSISLNYLPLMLKTALDTREFDTKKSALIESHFMSFFSDEHFSKKSLEEMQGSLQKALDEAEKSNTFLGSFMFSYCLTAIFCIFMLLLGTADLRQFPSPRANMIVGIFSAIMLGIMAIIAELQLLSTSSSFNLLKKSFGTMVDIETKMQNAIIRLESMLGEEQAKHIHEAVRSLSTTEVTAMLESVNDNRNTLTEKYSFFNGKFKSSMFTSKIRDFEDIEITDTYRKIEAELKKKITELNSEIANLTEFLTQKKKVDNSSQPSPDFSKLQSELNSYTSPLNVNGIETVLDRIKEQTNLIEKDKKNTETQSADSIKNIINRTRDLIKEKNFASNMEKYAKIMNRLG